MSTPKRKPMLTDLPDARGVYPFKWTKAANTDLRQRFNGIRWQMARDGIEPRRVRVPALVVERVVSVPRKG